MARQRLGVVLLVPQPLATQIDGVRRALGDGALARIPPHLTLVPPVNVAERDLPSAMATVRAAATGIEPLSLTVGPVATFLPVNSVAYLQVSGASQQMAALGDLRERCLDGPLARDVHHEFVPHVTVADELASARLQQAVDVLGHFTADVSFDRVHVLAEQPGRVWVPVADTMLGRAPSVVGRGGLPLELSITGRPDIETAALLAIDGAGAGRPFAVAARRDGTVVGGSWGWTSGGWLEVADLVVAVAHRGEGIGRHLLRAVEAVAGDRSCTALGIAAPSDGAAASLLQGAGWVRSATPSGSGPAHRRWERRLGDE